MMKHKRSTILLLAVVVLSSFAAIDREPQVFLVGDSTIADKKPDVAPETGWGTIFRQLIGLKVNNHAVNGRSTRSFRTLGHWKGVIDQVQAGDWVLIQFGHNDSKESDTSRYAAADTDYRRNLTRYVQEVKAKGGRPVLITPVMRRKFDDAGNFVDQHGDYPRVAKEVAAATQTPLIDLHTRSKAIITGLGVDDSRAMFLNLQPRVWPAYPDGKDDNTHFTPYGAALIAKAVADEIRRLNLDLAQYLTVLPSGKYAYELPDVQPPSFRKDTFNVTQFGAIADGLTVNTRAMQRAINSCSDAGGGTVVVPAGYWLTGPLALRSNVNLHVAKDAVLQFSDNTLLYPMVKTNWEGLDAIRAQSPISATGAVNIAITGQGIIDGAGQAWRPVKKNKLSPPEWEQLVASGGALNEKHDTWYPTERALAGSKVKRPGVIAEGYDTAKAAAVREFLRPNLLSLVQCKRVLLEGVTFQNSPAWCLHPLLTQHLTLRNLTVRNPWNAQNGDGVDIESCRYVLVENSSFDVGDDGICIKSGRDEEGRRRGLPTEDVIVRHCTVFHGHGGFVVGSEMSGGARNIFVSDCNFLGTDIGLRFKTTRGRGGVVEKIYMDNIRMSNIGGAAILFDMYYMAKDPLAVFSGNDAPAIAFEPVTEATPQFRDMTIRHVVCKGAETAVFVRGLPEMNIARIHLEDLSIQSLHGVVCTEGDGITIKNATLHCSDPVVADLRDSKNIVLDNIRYTSGKTLMTVNGSRSKEIKVLNTAAPPGDIKLGAGVSEKIIKRK